MDIRIIVDGIKLNVRSGIIIIKDNKILLHKNDNRTNYALPGGGVHFLESSEEAIIREIKEETGLDIKVDECISTIENMFEKDGIRFHEIYFIYKGSFIDDVDTNKVIENIEGKPLKYSFVDLDNLDDYYILPVVVKDIIKNKTSHVINREID
jgi:ADP-ribose pyrophosphatase YjhB (NUDIX family)